MVATVTMNSTEIPFFSDSISLRHYVESAPPFYFTSRLTVLESMTDEVLALIAPVVTYWLYSLFFVVLDNIDTPLINKYRIHESSEVTARNRVSRLSCFLWVVFQQCIQTALGLYWMESTEGIPELLTDVQGIRNGVVFCAKLLLGENTALHFLRAYGPASVWFVYWWAIPVAQLFFAM